MAFEANHSLQSRILGVQFYLQQYYQYFIKTKTLI